MYNEMFYFLYFSLLHEIKVLSYHMMFLYITEYTQSVFLLVTLGAEHLIICVCERSVDEVL